MSRLGPRLAIVAAMLFATLGAASAHAEIDPKALAVVPFDKLTFKGNPEGAQVAVVFGDPAKAGMYGIVVKWPPHANSRPHSHPNNRYITVLSGTWWVNTGAKYSPETMVPIKPGAFVIHYGDQIHYDGAKDEEAVLYIVGMGPAPTIDREQK